MPRTSWSLSPRIWLPQRPQSRVKAWKLPGHQWYVVYVGNILSSVSQPVDLNPFGVLSRFPAYQIFTTWLITIAKLQFRNSSRNKFMVEVTAVWGTMLKGRGIRRVENHWQSLVAARAAAAECAGRLFLGSFTSPLMETSGLCPCDHTRPSPACQPSLSSLSRNNLSASQ